MSNKQLLFRAILLSAFCISPSTVFGFDPEAVTILKNSREEWQALRRSNPEKTIDLNKAKLEDADLEGANLSNVSLVRAELSGANLNRANLQKTNLAMAFIKRPEGSQLQWRITDESQSQGILHERSFVFQGKSAGCKPEMVDA